MLDEGIANTSQACEQMASGEVIGSGMADGPSGTVALVADDTPLRPSVSR
jgi:hypothetical protein